MFTLEVTKSNITVSEKEPLVQGAVNVYTCRMTYGPDWEGLDKTVVFKTGAAEVSVVPEDNSCTIPHEVTERAGESVRVGVYGTKNGERVLPTLWADLGIVWEGAKPGAAAQTPAPELYDQLLSLANGAAETADGLRAAAEAGAFDGKQGAAGKDGHTPVKGVDYWTDADKEEIISGVAAQLESGDEVSY